MDDEEKAVDGDDVDDDDKCAGDDSDERGAVDKDDGDDDDCALVDS